MMINPSVRNPFALSLMELLAIRLGCPKTPAKSLVMSKGHSWFDKFTTNGLFIALE
jgi:hypothetical protein